MPITIEPAVTDLGQETVGTNFNFLFSATSDEGEIIAMSVTPSIENSGVTVTSSSVSGAYTSGVFPNSSVTYVDKGESDKTQKPVTLTGSLDAVPNKKEILEVAGDPVSEVTVTYVVTAEDDLGETASQTYSYIVMQDYSPIHDWLEDYMENRY
jgi:hypothetical protein